MHDEAMIGNLISALKDISKDKYYIYYFTSWHKLDFCILTKLESIRMSLPTSRSSQMRIKG
jgi:hypothetical protein